MEIAKSPLFSTQLSNCILFDQSGKHRTNKKQRPCSKHESRSPWQGEHMNRATHFHKIINTYRELQYHLLLLPAVLTAHLANYIMTDN